MLGLHICWFQHFIILIVGHWAPYWGKGLFLEDGSSFPHVYYIHVQGYMWWAATVSRFILFIFFLINTIETLKQVHKCGCLIYILMYRVLWIG